MNIDEEARDAAECFLARTFVKCGTHYYRLIQVTGEDLYREYTGLRFVTPSSKLSDADRINGIEWSGSYGVEYTATRDRRFNFPMWSAWSRAENGKRDLISTLTKEKGAWEIGDDPLISDYKVKTLQGYGTHIRGAEFPCQDVLNDAQHTSPRP